MLKKVLFFAALFAPVFAARAALPTNCSIDTNGVMTCAVDGATNSGDFVNTGITPLDSTTISSGNNLNSVDLSVWAGSTGHPGNIINTGGLSINVPGAVEIGGWIYNGTSDGTTGTGSGYLALSGSTITIENNQSFTNGDPSYLACTVGASCSNASTGGAAILNLSSGVGASNWTISLNAAANLNINGSVWSNTINGTGAFGPGGGSIMLAAGNDLIITSGDFIAFGGDKQTISAGNELIVNGRVIFMGGAAAGANTMSSAAAMRIGVGGFAGDALTIANGATTAITSGQSITINGNLVSSSGTTTINAIGNMQVNGTTTNSATALNITAAGFAATGTMTNSAGTTTINAGGYANLGGLNITSGLVKMTGGSGMVLGADGLSAAALQLGGAAPATGLYITPASYAIQSANAINITNAIDVEAGTLTIAGTGPNITLSSGSIINRGGLSINGYIDSVLTGAIGNYGTLNITTAANGITAGNITTDGGALTMNAKIALSLGTIISTGTGTATFIAGTTIGAGAIENNMTMSFAAAGNITTGGANVINRGNLEITSSGGTINVGDVNNSGNIRFDGAGDITIENLTNSKSFWAETDGVASFTTLTNQTGATEFHLKAATTNISTTQLESFLLNTIPTMYLELTAQTLTTTGDITNATGNLTAKATAIGAVNATNASGLMDMTSTGSLALSGAVQNGTGIMNLSGTNVSITGSIASGGTTNIAANTAFSVGNITNSAGALTIGAGTANIRILTNSGGTTTINSNGPTIMGVTASGGAVNLNGTGTITITNNLSATNGTINIANASGVTADGINIGTTGTISTNGGGKLNIDSGVPFIMDVGSGTITAGGISMTGTNKTLQLNAGTINLNNGAINVVATNTLKLNAPGIMTAGSLTSNGQLWVYGTGLTIANNATIGNGGIDTEAAAGLWIDGAASFALKTTSGSIIDNGGINVGTTKTLSVESAGAINVGAAITNAGTLTLSSANASTLNAINNSGALTITAKGLSTGAITNNVGTIAITNSNGGNLVINGDLTNSATINITNNNSTTATAVNGTISVAAGATTTITGASLIANKMTNATGGQIVFNGTSLKINNNDSALGLTNLVVGTGAFTDGLQLTNNNATMTANRLDITGALNVYANAKPTINFTTALNVAAIDVAASAKLVINGGSFGDFSAPAFSNLGDAEISAGEITIGNNITNSSRLVLSAAADLTTGNIANNAGGNIAITTGGQGVMGSVVNAGTMSITAWGRYLDASNNWVYGLQIDDLTNTAIGSRLTLAGYGLQSAAAIDVGNIYRNASVPNTDTGGSVAVNSNDFTMVSATNIAAGAVRLRGQTSQTNILTLTAPTIATTGDLTAEGIITNIPKIAELNINAMQISVNGKITTQSNGFVNLSAANWAPKCPYDQSCAPGSLFASDYAGAAITWASIASGAASPLMYADITGDVSGGVRFYGAGRIDIGGNYEFTDDSILALAALPSWAAADFTSFGTIARDPLTGKITTTWGPDAKAMVNVVGKFKLDILNRNDAGAGELHGGNIGLTIFSAVEKGTIVWLVDAAGGVEVAPDTYLPRNMKVYFCNADGTKCFDYVDSLHASEGLLPVYLRWNTSPSGGQGLFAVFDPDFGGPMTIYWIGDKARPLKPETNAAQALSAIDDLVYYGLPKAGFSWRNKNPIEAIPAAFKGGAYDGIARALYDRMESYSMQTGDARPFVDLARLVMPTEIAAMSAMSQMTERMTASGLSKRMQDETLWTRNRVKTKAWADIDAGVQSFENPDPEGDAITGTRLAASGGYDIQINKDLIVGFTAGLAVIEAADKTKIDIGLGETQTRNAVAKDTDFHIGGYVLSRVADQLRVFVHAAAHSHKLAVSGDRGITGDITGSGETASIVGELGLVHSISAQYVVGTLSARFVQNNGFKITEQINGEDYMNLQTAAATSITPAYTILFQKRMYLKPTFIMRPFASFGAEYDMTESTAAAKWKFAASDAFSEMELPADPLWLRAQAGVEFLTIGGLQFGAGAEYLYNAAAQSIGVRATASVRF